MARIFTFVLPLTEIAACTTGLYVWLMSDSREAEKKYTPARGAVKTPWRGLYAPPRFISTLLKAMF